MSSCNSPPPSLGGGRGGCVWGDVVVDERCVVVLETLSALRRDAALSALVHALARIQAHATHAYVLLHADPAKDNG